MLVTIFPLNVHDRFQLFQVASEVRYVFIHTDSKHSDVVLVVI